MLNGVKHQEHVTIRDLYEEYPDFHIDVQREQNLLVDHDVIVWHHPFYWYSCPPIIKQWIDTVLEYGWAYGKEGNALQRKKCLQVITAGAEREVYCQQGSNVYTVNEFLRPFEQTARLCKMDYLPPYAVMGTHKLDENGLQTHVKHYQQIMRYLAEDRDLGGLDCRFENDLTTATGSVRNDDRAW